jgi:hypothetical protein
MGETSFVPEGHGKCQFTLKWLTRVTDGTGGCGGMGR